MFKPLELRVNADMVLALFTVGEDVVLLRVIFAFTPGIPLLQFDAFDQS